MTTTVKGAKRAAEYYHLSRPEVTDDDVRAVVEVLRSPSLALGPRLAAFEKAFAEYIGRRHAVAVNSGTSGLHLAVRALGISDGDEVVTTPFSFVASANCVLFERAVPKFVDIDPETLNLDVLKMKKAITEKTKAILPVHIFGLPSNMDAVCDLAKTNDLAVIEDACEAIGATYKGRRVGVYGDAAVFAFYPNKQMTTGEGGVLVTDDTGIAEAARSMRNQGRSDNGGWLDHVRLGFNYRLDEMSAALGLSQLGRIDDILARRGGVAAWYNDALASVRGVKTLPDAPHTTRSWFVYVVVLDAGIDRQKVIARLEALGVQSRAYFSPIHLQPFYREAFGYSEGAFPVCEDIANRTLALPFYNSLSKSDVESISHRLAEALK